MKKSPSKKHYGFAVMVLLAVPLLSACSAVTTMRMAAPQGIADKAEVLAVNQRSSLMADSGFMLGDYTVSDAKRDWTTTTTESVGPVSKEVTTGAYRYTLSKGSDVLTGNCSTGEIGQNVALGSGWHMGEHQKGLSCTCGDQAKLVISTDDLQGPGGNNQVTYEANGKRASPWFTGETYKGRVFLGNESYDVTAIHEVEGGINLPEPSGYRVSKDKAFVAIVEVLPPGTLWLAKDLSTQSRDAVSCLLTGLMFYRPAE